MLVFTQFREMTTPLATFLGGVFGRPGLILHGNTAVKDRKDLVRTFQEDEAVPFFVLSLKAGGSGSESDRGVPRRAFRSLVEPGGREPGYRPGLPHQAEEECHGS